MSEEVIFTQINNTQMLEEGEEEKSLKIVHALADLHICSIDTPDCKVLCRSSRHFGCKIATSTGHRNIFFLTYAQMLEGVKNLLWSQNFPNRASQYYKVQQCQPQTSDSSKLAATKQVNWIVRHKLTG